MKSQGNRNMNEEDDSGGGGCGKMLKVLSLTNVSSKNGLEHRKLMFEKDMEERKLERIKEKNREKRAKDRK
ncbi:hypothetical protein H310_15155, partial [Aphanomyces invadans]